MKKKLFLLIAVVFTMLLTSCGAVSTSMSNYNQNQTQVILSKKNFKIVKAAAGESQQTYVLGFGGLSRKSLHDDAMRDLLRNAQMTGSQALVNTNVTYHYSNYLFVVKVKCSTSALVIEYTDD